MNQNLVSETDTECQECSEQRDKFQGYRVLNMPFLDTLHTRHRTDCRNGKCTLLRVMLQIVGFTTYNGTRVDILDKQGQSRQNTF